MSSFNFEEEGDDLDNWNAPITGRNCFVLMIDAGEAMFMKTEDGKSYFQLSVECCKEIFLNIARKQKMDLVSIVLYGTDKSEGLHAPNNVVLLLPPTAVTVSRIKRLTALINTECQEVKTNYGHSDKFVLAHALHYCQTVILECRRRVYIKNVVLFTCDDNPHATDTTLQHQARKQAEEYLGHLIDFDVVGLGHFNSSKFYKELVLTSRGELLRDWADLDPISNVNTLLRQIDKVTEKFTQRRSLLRLGKDCTLLVSLYKLYSEPKKFRTEYIPFEETQKIEGDSQLLVDDVEGRRDVLEDSENADRLELSINELDPECEITATFSPTSETAVARQVFIGQEHVPITKTEVNQGFDGINQGFNLLGFVNTDDVPLYFTRGEPYLMIPGSNLPNARLIFSHLVKTCAHRGKSIVGWFKLNKSARPSHAILHPSLGAEYATDREHSPGFILAKLPFVDELNEPDEESEALEPNARQQEAADNIVKKLTIPYKVDHFSDPEVKYTRNMIEALALDYDDIEPVEDDTDVDLEGIDERLGKLIEDFNDCEYLGPEVVAAGKKSATKPALTLADMLQTIRSGGANKLTVAQLRELLSNEGVKNLNSMNKPMLVSVAKKRFGG